MADPRLAPHDSDAEREVLGFLLLDPPNAAPLQQTILTGLTPEDFYVAAHRILFVVMSGLIDADVPIDNVILCNELRRIGKLEECGGMAGVAELLVAVWPDTAIPPRLHRIRQASLLRRLSNVLWTAELASYEPGATPEEILEMVDRSLKRIKALLPQNGKAKGLLNE